MTGEVEPKLHIHHRLKVPTRSKAEHLMLKEARRLAAMLVGADKSNVPSRASDPLAGQSCIARRSRSSAASSPAIPMPRSISPGRSNGCVRRSRQRVLTVGSSGAKSNGGTTPNNLRAPCIEAVIGALAIIPNDDLEWDEWNYVGLATQGATAGSDEGGEAFATWSAKSKKNDPATTQARWEHYHTSPPTGSATGRWSTWRGKFSRIGNTPRRGQHR